ncbi:hypothetical protein BD324DRAFT_74669 [Kockovaella imperatae]|uniref:Endonuclease/exonuclease/phosphatase n=1 Tax=Kockovaella imperatae TaxID=4999 RepID=A0A1Y1UCK2_9TREE|nr:hypothetical protein BD324DRAFT_74669 [Kockovaella imperatae]ORX35739.1 hypothetical protein BD324DRAFT_74669 [Kockovaella imperatae]
MGSRDLISLHVFGIYATQATNPETAAFWDTVKQALTGKQKWIAAGDFNQILDERDADATHALQLGQSRNSYRGFLSGTNGVDLWRLQDDVNLEYDWTRATQTGDTFTSRSIIDRIAAGPDVPGGDIRTCQVIVRGSDHRGVISNFAIPVLPKTQWENNPAVPRLVKPRNGDERFDEFRRILQAYLKDEPDLSRDIITDSDFDLVYKAADVAFRAACEEAFHRPKRPPTPDKIQLPVREQRLKEEINAYNKAIGLLRRGGFKHMMAHLKRKGRLLLDKLAHQDTCLMINFIQRKAAERSTALAQSQADRLSRRIKRRFTAKVRSVIYTGSVKRLMPNQAIRMPSILRIKDGGYTQTPIEYIHEFRSHFEGTFRREHPTRGSKPWMDSRVSREFNRQAQTRPLQWPPKITADDIRLTLDRGSVKPAPGPDNWEKWALRQSGTEWLTLMAKLVRYIVQHNYFPPILKENYICSMYKREVMLETNNYGGIVLANTLQILVASVFTRTVQDYANAMGMIPDTQIAGRAGAQVGDLTHLLHALDGYANLVDKTWFALKRDQKKGFDFIHQSGWDDAVKFFGLPDTINVFDKARTSQVSLRVKVRTLVSDPIITDGLTKQGDPFSPIKYVLVTAMALWWAIDKNHGDGMLIESSLHNMDNRRRKTPSASAWG